MPNKIEILVTWDSDNGGDLTVFVDGVRTDDASGDVTIEWVDPGAGYLLSGWREDRAQIEGADYSPAFKAAYLSAHDEAEGSEYIEDDLGEEGDDDE